MNATKMMHDLGVKITNDIMEPVIDNFNEDIKRVEAKLDKLIAICEKWEEEE